MSYDRDKTFSDLATEAGRVGRALRHALVEAHEREKDWHVFKDDRFPGCTLTQIAIALGRVTPGTAQAGAASAITLAEADEQPDDFYNGFTVRITGGTGVGQEKTITDYDEATNVATVDSAWDTEPDDTSTYALQTDLNLLDAAITDAHDIHHLAAGDTTLDTAKDMLVNIVKFT